MFSYYKLNTFKKNQCLNITWFDFLSGHFRECIWFIFLLVGSCYVPIFHIVLIVSFYIWGKSGAGSTYEYSAVYSGHTMWNKMPGRSQTDKKGI